MTWSVTVTNVATVTASTRVRAAGSMTWTLNGTTVNTVTVSKCVRATRLYKKGCHWKYFHYCKFLYRRKSCKTKKHGM